MIDPLVPPDTDCTDLDGFFLNVERMMSSELVAIASREAIGAALLLWCKAWKQIPASSLSDDDRVNAAFCGLPLSKFKKMKGDIMRGFIKCSDGRLYHKTLSQIATAAYARKKEFKERRERDAKRLREWRAKQGGNADETRFNESSETRFVRTVKEGEGKGKGISSLSSREDSTAVWELDAAPNDGSYGGKVVNFGGPR